MIKNTHSLQPVHCSTAAKIIHTELVHQFFVAKVKCHLKKMEKDVTNMKLCLQICVSVFLVTIYMINCFATLFKLCHWLIFLFFNLLFYFSFSFSLILSCFNSTSNCWLKLVNRFHPLTRYLHKDRRKTALPLSSSAMITLHYGCRNSSWRAATPDFLSSHSENGFLQGEWEWVFYLVVQKTHLVALEDYFR